MTWPVPSDHELGHQEDPNHLWNGMMRNLFRTIYDQVFEMYKEKDSEQPVHYYPYPDCVWNHLKSDQLS